MMSFFTGTVTEMKSGHTQWSCSMPATVSVTRDYFVAMLVRKGLRAVLTLRYPPRHLSDGEEGQNHPIQCRNDPHEMHNICFKITKPQFRIEKVWILI